MEEHKDKNASRAIRVFTREEADSYLFLSDLYLKRPDLRFEEKPQGEDWKPFIDPYSLYSEVLDQDALIADTEGVFSNNYDLEISDLKIMQLFCVCREWRIYPPSWLLDAITDRFSDYINASMKGDKRDLSEFFRVNKHDFKREAKKPLIDEAILDIERFTAWFKKVHQPEARRIVSGLFPALGTKVAGLEKSHKEWRGTCKAFVVSVELEIEPTDNQRLKLLEKYEHHLNSIPLEQELSRLRLKKIRLKKVT